MSAIDTSFSIHVAHLQRDPLLHARNEAQRGRRVIGYVGSDAPVELIIAANALPVRLVGHIDASTPRADQYLESSFHPECRAVAEDWLRGELDFIDAVLFSRNNDSAQRLYYYFCELQRIQRAAGPTPRLFDIAPLSRSSSVEHTLISTRRLAAELGTEIDALPAALARSTQRRTLLDRLAALRLAGSSIAGSAAYRVARVAQFNWSDAFDSMLENWLADARNHSYSSRVVLAGNAPPDERIHKAIESVNGVVVSECIDIECSIPTSANDCLAMLAERQRSALSSAQRMQAAADCLANLARKARADGVILWAIEEDEALPWEIARQVASLTAARIPVLSLTRQRWLSDDATLQNVAIFVSSLRQRS